MTRVKKSPPRQGDIFFDSRSRVVFVFRRLNHTYGLFEFEYVGMDEVVYTCGFDFLSNLNKLKA